MSAERSSFDPFRVPADRQAIAELVPRHRATIRGMVMAVECRQWQGGPALEVAVDDGTGSAVLAFLGRREIQSLAVGATVTAGGTFQLRHDRMIVMNPYIWVDVRMYLAPTRAKRPAGGTRSLPPQERAVVQPLIPLPEVLRVR